MIGKATGRKRGAWVRAVAGLLTLALLCGLLPAVTHKTASAASWADEYVDQVVEWGVMRGDDVGDLYPTQDITRAEFAAMINRAYGYTQTGPTPFVDVKKDAWYADDIAIAYTAGYLNGTSQTTASPDAPLTREEAVVILARNMMLEENAGEVLGFTDSRNFSDWSHGYIRSAMQAKLISGYSDGSFRPQSNITREEVAAILTRAIGTLIQEPGEQSLDSVYGNVVINTSGTTLRNTTIAGNLYLTGGIGLGDVLLENVNVLGKIVVSGAGESNKGDSSVILRNVTSNEMIVDSPNNQFITLRAEGNTVVKSTSVRTSAYLDDATAADMGLLYIELNGEDGTTFQVAGNIKEVLNVTPDSHLVVAAGTAEKITIDEEAVDASMAIEMGATVKELNLDVGTSVSGDGDIEKLNVNAAGCTVSMLPDQITIRPGLTANIHGEVMNSTTAAESSADPRLTASYPTVKDIAPNSATAVFSSNKGGTIYWAVTALADGSTSEADLISPPVYGGTIHQSGTITAAASKTEYTAALTELVSDGSYYLTTVMVDGRGQHSPVKVTAFTTPDDTVPGFTVNPEMTQVSTANAQVTVMPNKSCLMYYALLPKNAVAPTTADFKAASITGNLGYGSVDVTKNTTLPVNVNNVDLDELTDYVLYLWLTDYDNAKSSAVISVPFKTADETPPTITYLSKTDTKETSITMTVAMDEPGTFYWAVVKSGDPFLVPIAGQERDPDLFDEAAIIQTTSGVGALQKGNVAIKAGNTDYTFTINGLTGETAYDLYYIAKDSAGNYSLGTTDDGDILPMVKIISVTTLDTNPPTVEQEFTDYNGEAADNNPLPDTDINLVFNEKIQGVVTENGTRKYEQLLELYQKKDTDDDSLKAFVTALRNHFTLYQVVNGRPVEVEERTGNPDTDSANWVIDYRNAMVTQENGKMMVTFPTNTKNNYDKSALHLAAGTTYYFHIEGIADVAEPANLMGSKDLDTFHTVYAQVNLSEEDVTLIQKADISNPPDYVTEEDGVRVDMAFGITPSAVSRVADTEMYDVILWCNTPVDFEIYRRTNNEVQGEDGASVGDSSEWERLGVGGRITAVGGAFSGISLYNDVITTSGQAQFDKLNELSEDVTYEYAIQFTSVNGQTNYDSWSDLVTVKVAVVAGSAGNLRTLAGSVDRQWDTMTGNMTVSSIGVAYNASVASDQLILTQQFTDRLAPSFLPESPTFVPGSSAVQMNLALNRDGTIYYVIAPKKEYAPAITGQVISAENDYLVTEDADGKITVTEEGLKTFIPTSGSERTANPGYAGDPDNPLISPEYLSIVNPRFTGTTNIRYGKVENAIGYVNQAITIGDGKDINGNTDQTDGSLLPSTEYYVYFVLQGNGQTFTTVQCYQFETTPVETPIVSVQNNNPGANMSTNQDSYLYYALVEYNHLPTFIKTQKITVEGKSMTVLEALITMNDSGRSYFDLCEDPDLKQQVRDYISGDTQTGTATQPAMTGSIERLIASTTQYVDFNNFMATGAEYVVLTAARHVYGESYGFKAIRGLFKPDEIPPEYVGNAPLQATITKVEDSSGNSIPNETWMTGNPYLYTYSGRVTITFDKDVYQLINNVRYEVWQASSEYVEANNKADADGNKENVVSILDILGGGAAELIKVSNKAGAQQDFTFTFTNLRYGDTITFFNSGNISNASSYSTNKKLTLMFNPTLTYKDFGSSTPGDGNEGYITIYNPGFEVQWS